MYCIKCGVKLADTEKKCPLCNTIVCHPDFPQVTERPLYPINKMPQHDSRTNFPNVAFLVLFLIPLLACFFADFFPDGRLGWFGYVGGALAICYIAIALPLWFERPNPVIFVPCTFAAIGLYLLYINCVTNGNWFLGFALPVVGGICLIICTLVTLLRYLRKGKLFIFGGTLIATGTFIFFIEFRLVATFDVRFIGWSVYPLIVLASLGGLLFYLALNRSAREMIERKFFF